MRSLSRLYIFLKPYWLRILLSMFTLLAVTGLSLVVPQIIQQVIDEGLLPGQSVFLIHAALILLGLGILTAGLNLVQRYTSQWVAARVGYDMRNRMYDHIQYLTFTFHDHAQTGQLINRCIEDIRSVQEFAASSISDLVQLIVLTVGILALLFSTNWMLALIALAPIIPLLLMTWHFGERSTNLFLAIDNTLGEVSSRLQENVSGVQVVRAFARENHEIGRFDEANQAYYDSRIHLMNEWSKVMPTTTLLATIGTILILWFGGLMVIQGKLTVGEVVAFNAYMLMLAGPVQQLTWLVNSASEAAAGIRRVFDILDLVPEIRSPEHPADLPTLSGRVELRDVSLRYLDEKRASLSDISLKVDPNQIVALIGPTGSGKTSLINLLPRFYDVSEGAVLLDGCNVRELDLTRLRRQIGIVLQTSLLFSDSIRENIAYGRPDASMDAIVVAAKAAQAHDFILGFPHGYDTIVGERGVTLSGGQRQRVAIARALLMDPRILILDDSTSSVDTQTEKLIQEALDRLMEGRTTFVIAHRMSTIRRADLILVLDGGRIVQRGTHDTLLAEGGLYREIYELQLMQQSNLHDTSSTFEKPNLLDLQAGREEER